MRGSGEVQQRTSSMVGRAEGCVWITRVDERGEQRTAGEGEVGRAGGALLYPEPGVQAPETPRRSGYRCVWTCQVGESRKARYAHMSGEARVCGDGEALV